MCLWEPAVAHVIGYVLVKFALPHTFATLQFDSSESITIFGMNRSQRVDIRLVLIIAPSQQGKGE